jgi:hypothetical protein
VVGGRPSVVGGRQNPAGLTQLSDERLVSAEKLTSFNRLEYLTILIISGTEKQ